MLTKRRDSFWRSILGLSFFFFFFVVHIGKNRSNRYADGMKIRRCTAQWTFHSVGRVQEIGFFRWPKSRRLVVLRSAIVVIKQLHDQMLVPFGQCVHGGDHESQLTQDLNNRFLRLKKLVVLSRQSFCKDRSIWQTGGRLHIWKFNVTITIC